MSDYVAELRTQLNEALDALEDVISQACYGSGADDEFDSMALSAYADGLRLLAEHGRVVIVREYGRRVIAKRP
jgi:hypothetical protein